MFGSGMFTAMQKAKAGRGAKAAAETVEEKLEKARKLRAAEAAAGREKIKAHKAMRERVAAAEAQALREEAELVAGERAPAAAAVAREAAEYEALLARRDPSVAARWFYLDDDGERRGPFAPKKMRAWFVDGHLPPSLEVAPAFDDGKVPGKADMRRIDAVFAEPLLTSAFRSAAPPAASAAAAVPEPETREEKKKRKREAPAETGNWLQDSLDRQRRGVHARRHDRNEGPAMLYETYDA